MGFRRMGRRKENVPREVGTWRSRDGSVRRGVDARVGGSVEAKLFEHAERAFVKRDEIPVAVRLLVDGREVGASDHSDNAHAPVGVGDVVPAVVSSADVLGRGDVVEPAVDRLGEIGGDRQVGWIANAKRADPFENAVALPPAAIGML